MMLEPEQQSSNAWWWSDAGRRRRRIVLRFALKASAAVVMIAVTIFLALFMGGTLWQWKPATYLARILILPAVIGGLVVWLLANMLIERTLPLPTDRPAHGGDSSTGDAQKRRGAAA